jgi:hypothetical protein
MEGLLYFKAYDKFENCNSIAQLWPAHCTKAKIRISITSF